MLLFSNILKQFGVIKPRELGGSKVGRDVSVVHQYSTFFCFFFVFFSYFKAFVASDEETSAYCPGEHPGCKAP